MSLYIATVCAWPSFGVAVMLRYENGRDKRTRSVGEIGLRNVALTLTVKHWKRKLVRVGVTSTAVWFACLVPAILASPMT